MIRYARRQFDFRSQPAGLVGVVNAATNFSFLILSFSFAASVKPLRAAASAGGGPQLLGVAGVHSAGCAPNPNLLLHLRGATTPSKRALRRPPPAKNRPSTAPFRCPSPPVRTCRACRRGARAVRCGSRTPAPARRGRRVRRRGHAARRAAVRRRPSSLP